MPRRPATDPLIAELHEQVLGLRRDVKTLSDQYAALQSEFSTVPKVLSRLAGRGEKALERLLAATVETTLDSSAAPASPAKPRGSSALTDGQRNVIDRVSRITGNDGASRQEIERLLRELEGEKATEPLVTAVKDVLKARDIGVRCTTCGEPSQLVWQRSSRYSEGGILVLSHHTGGKRHLHSATTRLPKMTVVPRPDRRSQRPRAHRF